MDPQEASVEPDPPSLRATTSVTPPAPRWGGAARVGACALAALALLVGGMKLAPRAAAPPPPAVTPPPIAAVAPAPTAEAAPQQARADADLVREGRSSCAEGALVVLPDFASENGQFDLVIQLHGGTEVVTDNLAAVKLNAVAVVLNLGVGSGVYEQRFSWPPRFSQVREAAELVLARRHLENPRVRRIALSAFSAGFGGVLGALERPGAADEIDSIILLDGLQASRDEHHAIDLRRLEPLIGFARAAARGEKLLFITHSEISTFSYASAGATSDALLELLGVTRQDGKVGDAPAAAPPLELLSHAERGSLFVRGYAGTRAEDHIAHLHQMGKTALPALAARWATAARPD